MLSRIPAPFSASFPEAEKVLCHFLMNFPHVLPGLWGKKVFYATLHLNFLSNPKCQDVYNTSYFGAYTKHLRKSRCY